jgi:hypothetical protein
MKEDTTPIDPTWMAKTGGFARDKTLRDEFAGLAITGLSLHDVPSEEAMRVVVNDAYRVADAMLKAREAK